MTEPTGIPKLSDNQVKYYFRRICKLLNSNQINITIKRMKITTENKKKRKLRGLSLKDDESGNQIWLNPDYQLLPTLVHECLHLLYWHKKEKWVEVMEKRISKRLSEPQMQRLLAILAKQLESSKPAPLPPIDSKNSLFLEDNFNLRAKPQFFVE